MKMPKRLKARWIAALRSGEYGQTAYTLCDGNGNFCCLGVLEHVALKGEVEADGDYLDFPTEDFYEYAGIVKDCAEDIDKELAALNDGGLSFKKLARKIEKEVETY